jgi:hypothetical protein
LKRLLLGSLLVVSLGAHAQESVGILSFVDIDPNLTRLSDCLASVPDPRECVPNVELIHVDAFRACADRGFRDCAEWAYLAPFIPEATAEAAERDIANAWERYVDRTIDEINREINHLFLPCWIPSLCPSVLINWDCVMQRLQRASETSLSQYLPEYWADVLMAIATNLPFALWWESPFPDGGAVIAPVFSLTPKPAQYTGLVQGARDAAYYFDGRYLPFLFPDLPVPYAPGEATAQNPGIPQLEARKRQLERATLLEYQQFGFSSFFFVHGGHQDTLFFKLERGPYLLTFCFKLTPPAIVPNFPIPVPGFIPQVPKAFTAFESVPEGYAIPRVKGRPTDLLNIVNPFQ